MPTANVALADLVTALETLNAFTEQNSNSMASGLTGESCEMCWSAMQACIQHLESLGEC